MKVYKGKDKSFFFMSLLVSFYLVFRVIFFDFFGHASVDLLIGSTIFFLFFLIYKKIRYSFYHYLWDLTKNLYLNFFTLFKLLISLRKLVLGYNEVYIHYFRYSLLALRLISKTTNVIYKKLVKNLLYKFQINLFINRLNLKFFFVNTRTNYLPIEYSIINNVNMELTLFISYDVLFFIL